MARKFLTALDLAKNELQNPAIHNLASAPSSPVKGQLYMNTTDNVLYWWNGTSWVSAAGGGTGFPGYGSIVAETTFGGSSTDGVATTVARSDHKHANPLHDNAAHSTIPINAHATATADYSMGGFKITNLASPTTGTDATNKSYVDAMVYALSWKDPVRAATTANITLSAPQTVDGVALIAGERCLVKDQTTQSANGIYTVQAGAWVRSADNDAATEIEGAAVFVMEGTVNLDTTWVCTANAPITVGTTALPFVQISGASAATAGAGLSASGNVFNVGAGTGITVAADTVALDTTYADGRYALVANGVKRIASPCAANVLTQVSHNFGTRDVIVSVYRTTTPWDEVDCDIEHTDTNTVSVRFTTAPAINDYRIVVMA